MRIINDSYKRLRTWADMVIFAHIIFTAPFMIIGIMLAGSIAEVTVFKVALLLIAQTSAQMVGMLTNRLSDYHIDSINPRTMDRALVTQAVSNKEAIWLLVANLVIFLAACIGLNWLCLALAPIALFMVIVYNYTKRFTWLCHIWLGLACALGPLGAWVGLSGNLYLPIWPLAMGCALWIAGFDVIYACNDLEFDRQHRLHSIPARFGREKALFIAGIIHIAALLCLLLVPLFFNLNYFYFAGCGLMALELVHQHMISRRHNLSMKVFTNTNSLIALTYFIFTIAALYTAP